MQHAQAGLMHSTHAQQQGGNMHLVDTGPVFWAQVECRCSCVVLSPESVLVMHLDTPGLNSKHIWSSLQGLQ
jgi:hypothetical protein